MLMSRNACAADLPAFALGALQAEEMCRVGEHPEECARCRTQVQSYLAVAALLALTAPLAEPTPVARQRMLACLTDTPVPRAPDARHLEPARITKGST